MADNVFDKYHKGPDIFADKSVFNPNYLPDELLHRDREVDEMASRLAPLLDGDRPDDFMITGPYGSGRTSTSRFVSSQLRQAGEGRITVSRAYPRSNNPTEYRYIGALTNGLISAWDERVPFTGWPTEKVYATLEEQLAEKDGGVLMIVDDIDHVGSDDRQLAERLRLVREESGKDDVGIVLIGDGRDEQTNTSFPVSKWPRVSFRGYTPVELGDIVDARAEEGFQDGVVGDGTVDRVVDHTMERHPADAGYAIDLLYRAGRDAQRAGDDVVSEVYVDNAVREAEMEEIGIALDGLPEQQRFLLAGILEASGGSGSNPAITGEVYNSYRELTKRAGIDSLTQRRVTDLVDELKVLGLVDAEVRSKGRYGRTKEISPGVIDTSILRQELRARDTKLSDVF